MSDTSRLSKHRRAALSLIGLACATPVAIQTSHAEQPSDSPSSSESLWGDKTDIAVGFGAAVGPRYMGARETRTLLAPSLSVSRGIFFADSLRGGGAEYLTDNGLYVSGALQYDFGRQERNSSWRAGSDRLRGMGEVTGATLANIHVSQAITPWLSLDSEAELRMAGYKRGNRYHLGLESTLLSNDTDSITLGVHAHIGDQRYNETYFGVNEQQHQSSRFSRFSPKSGVYAYSTSLDWQHSFNRHWTLLMGLNLMSFSDRAQHSPIVERDTSAAGFAMLDYLF